ncbi:acyltransferase [Sphaerisporangium krabiense]|uniref:Peptidoglycan/LPS O-acetylase OafA/YrhL n=1 Tax=Sphaerisporangium krabiense TaxID=763782 RepID=A0A7W9DTH9_9ACTN|nr:acyltransferase [Sphaerisporangium krabiense]MBB5630204.1 peptidoglycan/LPS O-acetylase OafA/YrhL [Sphaerisporangium krabiense]GII67498.1 acyltransferase [Sphaerisporangium krabiense]
MAATTRLSDVEIGSNKRIPKLEGVRGVLAMGVLVFHVAWQAGATNYADKVGNGIWGHLADGLTVMLPPFFLLSGLFLYRPFARAVMTQDARPGAGTFLFRRGLRILPAYWLLIAVVLLGINLRGIDSVWDVIRPVFALHFYLPDGQPNIGLGHSWTVPTELTFYLLLPVLAWLAAVFAGRGGDVAKRARAALWPAVLLFAVGIAWVTYTNLPSFKGPFEFWFWPFYYVSAFACGMALAVFSSKSELTGVTPAIYRAAAKHPNLFWLAALVIYVVNIPKPFGEPGMGTIGSLTQELVGHILILVFAVLFLLPLLVPEARSRLMDVTLANKPMRYLGRISYGIYLWHIPFQNFYVGNGNMFGKTPVMDAELRGTSGFWELFAFVAVGSVLAATLSYFLLERPLVNYFTRRAKRKLQSRIPVAPADDTPVPSERIVK